MADSGENKSRRELRSILFADVVGYTRLMQDDEEATHAGIVELVGLFTKGCSEFDGVVLEIRGDGIFALFASAVNSVRFAEKIQETVGEYNNKFEEKRKILFRIGIHLGDVIRDKDFHYGDSVNIAARIEGLAEPGGVCISSSVYQQVKHVGNLYYEYLGPQQLKNITEPVKTYRIAKEANTAVLIASPRQAIQSASREQHTKEVRPSVAVVPFKNSNGNPEFDYFSDGITEDIITNLSKFQNLFVIARSSSFTYKNRMVPAKTIGNELGVRYLVDGTVRSSGNRVRISVQLVDTDKDSTLWTEYYDRNLDYIFEVQDEISAIICNVTATKVEKEERARLERFLPANLQAYEYVLQGQQQIYQYTKSSVYSARKLYESAVNFDPRYARALASISRTLNLEWRYSWSDNPEESLSKALALAREAVAMDADDARGYSELGFVNLYRKKHDLSLNAYNKARKINPNDAEIIADMADVLVHSGHSDQAIELMEKAMRLNPFYPDQYLWHLAGAQFKLKRYEDTIATVNLANNPTEGERLLAACFAHLGQEEKARWHADRVLEAHPEFSLKRWRQILPDKYEHDTNHFIEGLQIAGLR